MWRHGYNTSFYQLAEQMASPATKATVLSTIINRNDSTFPTDADYFKILQTCKALSCLHEAPSCLVEKFAGLELPYSICFKPLLTCELP